MRRRIALLIAAVLCAALGTACNGGSGDGASAPSSGQPEPTGGGAGSTADLVTVKVENGTVDRPASWQESSARLGTSHVAQFLRKDPGGDPVVQMDVFSRDAPAGVKADALMAGVQGARTAEIPSLRTTRRDFTKVPGAASAFLTESAYVFPDGRTKARSVETLAVSGDGAVLHVRVAATEPAFDAGLFARVLDSMNLSGGPA